MVDSTRVALPTPLGRGLGVPFLATIEMTSPETLLLTFNRLGDKTIRA